MFDNLMKVVAMVFAASSLAFATAQDAAPSGAYNPYAYLDCNNPGSGVITIYDEDGNVLWEGTEKEACEHLKLDDLCRKRDSKDVCQTEPLSPCVVNNPDGSPKISGYCKWTNAEFNGEEIPGGHCDCIHAPTGISANPGVMLSSLFVSLAGVLLFGLRSRGAAFPA